MEYCFFLIWVIFIVIITSHDYMGQELGGKESGVGLGVGVRMSAGVRYLGIC